MTGARVDGARKSMGYTCFASCFRALSARLDPLPEQCATR